MLKRDNVKHYPPSSPPRRNNFPNSKRPRTESSTANDNERIPTHRRTTTDVSPSTSRSRESDPSSNTPLSTRSPVKTSNDRRNDPSTMPEHRDNEAQRHPDKSFPKQQHVEKAKADVSSSNDALSRNTSQSKGSRIISEDGPPLIASVSNLAWHITMEDLKLLFGDIGEVQEIVMKKGTDGRFSGIAEVQYVNAEDAARCLESYSDVTFDNRAMRIRLINQAQPSPSYKPGSRREERRVEQMGKNFQDVRTRRPTKPLGESMAERGNPTNRDGMLDSRKDFLPPKAHSYSGNPRNLSQPRRPLPQQPREHDRHQQQPRAPADRSPPPPQPSPPTIRDRPVSEREQYDEERRRQRNLQDRAGMRRDNNAPHPSPDSWNRRSGPGFDSQWPQTAGSQPMISQHPHPPHHHHSMNEEWGSRDLKRNVAGQPRATFNPDQNVSRSNLPPPSSQRLSRSPPPPFRSDRRAVPKPGNGHHGNSVDLRRNGPAGRGPNRRFYPSQRDRDSGRNRPRPY